MQGPTIFGTFIWVSHLPHDNDTDLVSSSGGLIAKNDYYQSSKKVYRNYTLIYFAHALLMTGGDTR